MPPVMTPPLLFLCFFGSIQLEASKLWHFTGGGWVTHIHAGGTMGDLWPSCCRRQEKEKKVQLGLCLTQQIWCGRDECRVNRFRFPRRASVTSSILWREVFFYEKSFFRALLIAAMLSSKRINICINVKICNVFHTVSWSLQFPI